MDKNSLVLAYIGDSVYEIYIRRFLINKGICKVKELQKEAVNYVSAVSQASFLTEMLDNNFLTEDEVNVVTRARNHKSNHKPKNTSIVTYKCATGLEALIGYLFLDDNVSRIEEIMNFILER